MQKSTTDNKFLIKTGISFKLVPIDRSEIKPVSIKRFKNESSIPNEAFLSFKA